MTFVNQKVEIIVLTSMDAFAGRAARLASMILGPNRTQVLTLPQHGTPLK
jgi:hypothetical protein